MPPVPAILDAYGLPMERAVPREEKALAPPDSRGSWWPLVREPYAGAWQRNVTVDQVAVTAYHAVYAATTLIASDIAKLRVKLVRRDGLIWVETESPSFSPVLRKPNHFQTRIQFWESWILSKLLRGNTYVLKERDARGVVIRLYVLDPQRCKPLVADDGSVFYQLGADNLSGVEEQAIVPASEIIHDRWNCLFHPLVGISPIYAAGLAATQGLKIQDNSTLFFGNSSLPSGFLTAPGRISPETALQIKEGWEQNFRGGNAGRIAVMSDGLKFEPMTMTAVDAQLIDQLRWTAEVVCSVFHVPKYKIGIGEMPKYDNIQALNVEYYSQCLQKLIEDAELCLDEGLGLDTAKDGILYGTEFDLDGLLRMDSVTQMMVLKEGIGAGAMAPNEGRRKIDLPPVPGGDSPYLQQQNYSLAALAKRDARDDPFAKGGAAPPPPAQEAAGNAERRRAIADDILRRSRAVRLAA